MAYSVPNTAISAMMTAYRTASLDGGAIGLFTNNFTPVPTTVLGDFVEPGAEYGGYARITVATWGLIFTGPNGPECITQVQFPGPTSGAGDSIYGVFLVDSGGLYVAGARFDEGPQSMLNSTNILVVDLHSYGFLGGAESVPSVI